MRFCAACIAATTPKRAGHAFSLNGIGLHLYGRRNRCADCGSVEKTRWAVFIWIPVIPLGKYKVIYKTGVTPKGRMVTDYTSFFSRKLA